MKKLIAGLFFALVWGAGASAATINVVNQNFSRIDGPRASYYLGQTFTALDSIALDLTLLFGWRPIDLQVLITDVTQSAGVYYPGNVLFQSNVVTTPSTQAPPLTPYYFDLGGLQLTAGGIYAIILDAYSVGTNNLTDAAQVGVSNIYGVDDYTGGEMIALNLGPFPSGTRAQHFASGFFPSSPGWDLAFTMNFTSQPVPAPIPLPASLPLILVGLAGLGWVGRKRKRAA